MEKQWNDQHSVVDDAGQSSKPSAKGKEGALQPHIQQLAHRLRDAGSLDHAAFREWSSEQMRAFVGTRPLWGASELDCHIANERMAQFVSDLQDDATEALVEAGLLPKGVHPPGRFPRVPDIAAQMEEDRAVASMSKEQREAKWEAERLFCIRLTEAEKVFLPALSEGCRSEYERIVERAKRMGPMRSEAARLAAERNPGLGPLHAALPSDLFSNPPLPHPYTIDKIMPVAPGTFSAIGGVGKTRLAIWIAIHTALGLPIAGKYRVVRPGKTLFITSEDAKQDFEYRIYDMGMRFGAEDRKRIVASLNVVDLTELGGRRMVASDQFGNLEDTGFVGQLSDLWASEEVKLVFVDPMVAFGAGERFGNDADAKLLAVEWKLVRALYAGVCNVHHVAKVVGRENIRDVHVGRGGSAIGDNSRFVWQASELALERERRSELPHEVITLVEEGMRVVRLDFHKNSYGPRETEPLFLWDQGNWFEPILGTKIATAELLTREMLRACLVVKQQAAAGRTHSISSLKRVAAEERSGLAQRRLEELLHSALAHGLLQEHPADQKRGTKAGFLALTEKAERELLERRSAFDAGDEE